ncbi:hypothetical protein [Hasllibacter sp. MH4015]|uniref:hypothetical protein n=1 Tax=Hasllibacter sp. MH4015 TaxID=2854029 RepID=UPI001CD2E54F|nr:hypothetical protein [Hasllibacter sp. MH4015]
MDHFTQALLQLGRAISVPLTNHPILVGFGLCLLIGTWVLQSRWSRKAAGKTGARRSDQPAGASLS